MASQQLKVSMLVTADASAVAPAMGEARREVASVGTAARDAGAGLNKLSGANDQAAAAATRAMQAARGQAAAERELQSVIAASVGIRPQTSAGDYARRQADVEAYGAALDDLRAKYNPVYAAARAYDRELAELNRAMALGAINAEEHAAAMTMLADRYQRTSAAGAVYAEQAGVARMQTANLAFQFQDISTMLIAGQNPFILLSQQLPQVTMYGGRLSGVMGALRQTVAGLLSPLGLATTAFVLLGSAAVSYFSSLTSGSADAEPDLQQQADLIQRVADRWGDAIPALREYADEMKRAREAAELDQGLQAFNANELAEVRAQIKDAEIAVADLVSQLQGAGEEQAVILGLQGAFNAFADAADKGSLEIANVERVQNALATAINSTGIPALAQFKSIFDQLSESALAAAGNVQKAADASALTQSGRNLTAKVNGEERTSDLGRLDPLGFIDPMRDQNTRAEATKSQTQIEAERAASRGGSGFIDTYQSRQRAIQASIASRRLELDLIGKTIGEQERLRVEFDLLQQAREQAARHNGTVGEQEIENIRAQAEEMGKLADQIARASLANDLRFDRDQLFRTSGDQAIAWQLRSAGLPVDFSSPEAGQLRENARIAEIRQASQAFVSTFASTLESSGGDVGEAFAAALMAGLESSMQKHIDTLATALSNMLSSAMSGGGGFGGFGGFGGGGGFGLGSIINWMPGSQYQTALNGGIGLYDTGGWTGPGNPRDVAGITHRDEFVFSAPAVRTLGVGALDRLHRAARTGRGFDNGGYPGGTFPAGIMSAGSNPAGAGAPVLNLEQHFSVGGVTTPDEIRAAIAQGAAEAEARMKAQFAAIYERNQLYGEIN